MSERALELVRRHGRETISFQLLEPDFAHWFDGDDAMVAYVDTGAAWVAGGAPVAEPARQPEVAARFVAAARAAGRRACFFGCEREFLAAAGTPAMMVGEQPIWDPTGWPEILASSPSLRYQLRRARGKGVAIRVVRPDEVTAADAPLRVEVEALIAGWLASRGMAPMRFLVQVEPFGFPAERVQMVAERDGAVVGFASAVPIYRRDRLFVEDLMRRGDAPNGTVELLVDAMMGAAAARGDAAVTLGLAPLAGKVAGWLRLARRVSSPLYDFRGLHAFKAKLRPHAWEPVFLASAPRRSRLVALLDSLSAFAGGSLIRFGARTMTGRHRRLALPR